MTLRSTICKLLLNGSVHFRYVDLWPWGNALNYYHQRNPRYCFCHSPRYSGAGVYPQYKYSFQDVIPYPRSSCFTIVFRMTYVYRTERTRPLTLFIFQFRHLVLISTWICSPNCTFDALLHLVALHVLQPYQLFPNLDRPEHWHTLLIELVGRVFRRRDTLGEDRGRENEETQCEKRKHDEESIYNIMDNVLVREDREEWHEEPNKF